LVLAREPDSAPALESEQATEPVQGLAAVQEWASAVETAEPQ
jgi:hypothetical protein